jgi:hypothetical protein
MVQFNLKLGYAPMLDGILVIVVGKIRVVGSRANDVFSDVASSIK